MTTTWVVNNYRVKRWYYSIAPKPGDLVYYIDGTWTRVSSLGIAHIFLESGHDLIRRDLGNGIKEGVARLRERVIGSKDEASRGATPNQGQYGLQRNRRKVAFPANA